MNSRNRLTDEERNFFSLIYQAVLANPFLEERDMLDFKIAGLAPDNTRHDRVDKMHEELKRRIKLLEQENRDNINLFSGNDRVLLNRSFLFTFFYDYADRFDQLIIDQLGAGDTSVQVPFAQEAFSTLLKRGFSLEDVKRFFAMAYQFRRAFYFIHKSLVGDSPCMKNFQASLWNNVLTCDPELYATHLWDKMEDFSTLILGETGTGKGTAAMAIGRSGFIPFDEKKQVFVESFTRSFVSLNLSQFSSSLIESELFGHKKGAFTGAVEDHQGIFNRCSPFGSIFLDEIGEVSVPVQIKLLKVLEERAFSPVGSHKEFRFEGRIIAATNRTLDEINNNRVMRDDFFYRLCSDIIVIPPLRQRIREDRKELDDLLAHTIEKITGTSSSALVKTVRKTIDQEIGKNYHWPGNVRELGQCVRRILLNRSYNLVRQSGDEQGASTLAKDMDRGLLDAQTLLKRYCHMLYSRFGTYGEVARITKLDRRTVKKYVEEWGGE